MFVLTVEDSFSSAHQLRGYRGKCENIHGHNWRVVLSVKGGELNDIGLMVDFHDLKKILKDIISDLDHRNLNDIEFFKKFNPSSEIIAKYICEKTAEKLTGTGHGGIKIESVTVWESDTSRCTYLPD
jgi:6-pyruvoyltetrahydropterin/6-carboxytetrahydropterin synthase